MQWLKKIADELEARHPKGEIFVSSGVSPSGTYHFGTLREVLTAEVIARELRNRGRQSRHLHIVDDLDVFRKVPADVPEEFSKYLGRPLIDVPAPDGSDKSYADYYLQDLIDTAKKMDLDFEIIRAHEKYRVGFFTEAIEKALDKQAEIRDILGKISGHKVDEQWSPIQINEDGYLKSRQYVSHDTKIKTLIYKDKDGNEQSTKYDNGDVKLNWRVDWPARWWLLNVQAEPFGRDHATKGGSYDTGAIIVDKVFAAIPPLPIPYNNINRTGETKKMSKSAGDTITSAELLDVLPPEAIWFFILRYSPDKQLFFDEGEGLIKLIDDLGILLAKSDKSEMENHIIEVCTQGIRQLTVSSIPFSHLVASYQAALKDPAKTIEIIGRTEYEATVKAESETIKRELKFIDTWLNKHAPADVKFELRQEINQGEFNQVQKQFMSELADKIAQAPKEADGDWFHKAIYKFKDSTGLEPKELFGTLYMALIGQDSGPRAGWFLSILPRDWLIKRLRLEA